MKRIVLISILIALSTASNVLNISGNYRVIDSKCSKNVFSGCPYTKSSESSSWMCPNSDSNPKFTCDSENTFFSFRDDGYIYNSDIKMKIVFNDQNGFWVSTNTDIQEIIYECNSGRNSTYQAQCLLPQETALNSSQKKRILATQNSTKPCSILLELSSPAELYSESLDIYGKIFKCECGKISVSKTVGAQPVCSSSHMSISCSKDIVQTEFGKLICKCGRITVDQSGRYTCESGPIEVEHTSDFQKYSQSLSLVNSEFDELGNEVESISINMDAELTISSEISDEMIKIMLGFNMIDMSQVEVSKKNNSRVKSFFASSSPSSSSSSSSNPDETKPSEIKILYSIMVSRENLEEISEEMIKENMKRAVQKATPSELGTEETFDLFDTVAIKGFKQEIETYETKLKMAVAKEGGQRFLQRDNKEEINFEVVKDVEVENGTVDMLLTETEDEKNVILVKSYSETDFTEIQYDMGGEIPEIDHLEVTKYDKESGVLVEKNVQHSFKYTHETEIIKAKPHLKLNLFKKDQNTHTNDKDDEEGILDEVMFTKSFSTNIDFQSKLLYKSMNKAEIEEHQKVFENTIFKKVEGKEAGKIDIDEQFRIMEDVLDDEEKSKEFYEMFEQHSTEQKKSKEEEQQEEQPNHESSKLEKIKKHIQKKQQSAEIWRQTRIEQLKSLMKKLNNMAKNINELAKELQEQLKKPYKFESYYKIRNTKFFGQKCEIGIGFTQENEMTTAYLTVKLNDFIQFIIKEITFNSCSEVDRTLFEDQIEKTIFSVFYPIWGFINTYVKLQMKFNLQAKLTSSFNNNSQTCKGKLLFSVRPNLYVNGGVKAFALANIGLYGDGSFFTGDLAVNVEVWGPIKNQGEAHVSYSLVPFRYETGFFKNIIVCKFSWKKLFTFDSMCTMGESTRTPLYFNDFSNLNTDDRKLNFLQTAWGQISQPVPKGVEVDVEIQEIMVVQ